MWHKSELRIVTANCVSTYGTALTDEHLDTMARGLYRDKPGLSDDERATMIEWAESAIIMIDGVKHDA